MHLINTWGSHVVTKGYKGKKRLIQSMKLPKAFRSCSWLHTIDLRGNHQSSVTTRVRPWHLAIQARSKQDGKRLMSGRKGKTKINTSEKGLNWKCRRAYTIHIFSRWQKNILQKNKPSWFFFSFAEHWFQFALYQQVTIQKMKSGQLAHRTVQYENNGILNHLLLSSYFRLFILICTSSHPEVPSGCEMVFKF